MGLHGKIGVHQAAESAVNISYLLISNIKDNCNTALIAGQEMSPVSEAV